jgi:hypothetical protein
LKNQDTNWLTLFLEHYYLPDKVAPQSIASSFSSLFIDPINNTIYFTFNRANSEPSIENYFDLNANPNPYVIAAHGKLSSSGGEQRKKKLFC